VDPTTSRQVGRNEACPCGSGRKYKHCCLEKDEKKAREARARAAEKEAKAAAKAESTDEKGGAATEGAPARQPKKPPTYQPWKKASATNTQSFQRMSTPRKVGGS
jgi:SEC-C motif